MKILCRRSFKNLLLYIFCCKKPFPNIGSGHVDEPTWRPKRSGSGAYIVAIGNTVHGDHAAARALPTADGAAARTGKAASDTISGSLTGPRNPAGGSGASRLPPRSAVPGGGRPSARPHDIPGALCPSRYYLSSAGRSHNKN